VGIKTGRWRTWTLREHQSKIDTFVKVSKKEERGWLLSNGIIHILSLREEKKTSRVTSL